MSGLLGLATLPLQLVGGILGGGGLGNNLLGGLTPGYGGGGGIGGGIGGAIGSSLGSGIAGFWNETWPIWLFGAGVLGVMWYVTSKNLNSVVQAAPQIITAAAPVAQKLAPLAMAAL